MSSASSNSPPARSPVFTVAVVGNPNTGKSTLFSALTGLHVQIGNYPGVTVEKKLGHCDIAGRRVTLIDLPGTYSLSPRSLDEMVSVDVLTGRRPDVPRVDAILCIVDASNLERNLYLYSQLRDLRLPILLVLNMIDVAESRGVTIDVSALSARLQTPVVACSAHRRVGLDDVRRELSRLSAVNAADPTPFPAPVQRVVNELVDAFGSTSLAPVPQALALRLLCDVDGEIERRLISPQRHDLLEPLRAKREQLAAESCRVPAMESRIRYGWIREQLTGVVTRPAAPLQHSMSDRLDRWLTHPIIGFAVFLLVMLALFQALFVGAEPLTAAIEAGQSAIASAVKNAMPPGSFRSLIVDGVIAGAGGVVVFLPQIMLLFLAIALLEDCGYMARAAFLMDRVMTWVGLSGKSFVPLMSSFACAVPGIMATRTIENRRDRMATILIAPLMSCSARLPVYALVIGMLIPDESLGGFVSVRGLTLFLMLFLGAAVAAPIAWLLKSTVFRGETPPFVLELPAYKWPSPRIVFSRVYDRVRAFLMRAGTLICAASALVWALGFYPGDHRRAFELQRQIEAAERGETGDRPDVDVLRTELNVESSRLVEQSALGRMGRAIEPAIAPLGWDWRIGVAVIASFPAREVVIATLGAIFSLGSDVDESNEGLRATLLAATHADGRPLFTIASGLSLMVFFALCAQCASTLLVIRRETNSWTWPAVTFVYMTALAYAAALATYQIASRWN